MSLNDPFIMMPGDAVAKIAGSALSGGSLVLRLASADDLYVVRAVETAKDTRLPVEVPREYAALRSGDPSRAAQWIRVAPNDAHVHHLLLSRRPGTAIEFKDFKELVPGVSDPGRNLGVVVTHDPELPPELLEVGASKFAGWAVRRSGVQPLHIAIEPETVGLNQLAGRWPIEQLATNSVMVVGCGSIGSSAAEALAGYGVGRVELVDPDRFLWHNMLRHTLGAESVGRHKVAAMKDHLAQHWPQQTVVPHRLDVVADAHYIRPIVDRVDLVLCAADGIAPRRVVSHLSRRARKPAILACVLDNGSIGEVIRLRPTPRFGCLLCLRQHLGNQKAMDAEADQELDYGTGNVHQPMTAVPPDLRYVGTFAAKLAVATLLESLHGDHTQQIPGEHAIIGLRPAGDLAAPFDLGQAGDVRWASIPEPSASCATCSAE
ncbi:ThiF family adenylyltransferase [Arthrobacter sp. EH-1B-1]|uniref:ThiF family adenylyltransferase n=1 Tax=Arthrobacter vasquezii TaxID=2977629 RepID=A0ABT6CV29_9MICC|nr:ThiF family adenylyltransferase [Arthrobacter vasquezii]MDF9277738.1 ThiF family adenylyltransferase [Arthrobacter vasquezii]